MMPNVCGDDAPRISAPNHLSWPHLLVIADATINIAEPGYEAHLRHRLCVGTRPYKHVADLSDLTFRLLARGIEFQAKRLAGGVLKGPSVLANQLLCIRVADGNDLAV